MPHAPHFLLLLLLPLSSFLFLFPHPVSPLSFDECGYSHVEGREVDVVGGQEEVALSADTLTEEKTLYYYHSATAPFVAVFNISVFCGGELESPFVRIGTSTGECPPKDEEVGWFDLAGCDPTDPGFPQTASLPISVNLGSYLLVAFEGGNADTYSTEESGETKAFEANIRFLSTHWEDETSGCNADNCFLSSSYLYDWTSPTSADLLQQGKSGDAPVVYKTLISYMQRGYSHIIFETNSTSASLAIALGCSFTLPPDTSLQNDEEHPTGAYMFLDSDSDNNCLLLTYYPQGYTNTLPDLSENGLILLDGEIEKIEDKFRVEFIPSPLNTSGRLIIHNDNSGMMKNAYSGIHTWEAHKFLLGNKGRVELSLEGLQLGRDGMFVSKAGTCNPGYMGTPTIWRQEDIDKMETRNIDLFVSSTSSPCLLVWLITDQTSNIVCSSEYRMIPDKTVWFGTWLYPVITVVLVVIVIVIGCVIGKRRRRRMTRNERT